MIFFIPVGCSSGSCEEEVVPVWKERGWGWGEEWNVLPLVSKLAPAALEI